MAELVATAEDRKWAEIERTITRQFDRTRRRQRHWTIGLVAIVVMFVLFFFSSFASAATKEHADNFASLLSLITENGSNWVLGLAPIGLVGFQAMKQINQSEKKIEHLELSLVCIKQRDPDWKKYWHRANYSDEAGAAMEFLDNVS